MRRFFLFISLFSLLTCTAIGWNKQDTDHLIDLFKAYERLQANLADKLKELEALEGSFVHERKTNISNEAIVNVRDAFSAAKDTDDELRAAIEAANTQQHFVIEQIKEAARLSDSPAD